MVTRTLLVLSASAVLLAGSTFAQPAPVQAAPSARAAPEDGAHRVQRRVQEAHDRLGITPAQQPQWDAVLAALRDNMRELRASPAVQAIRGGQLSGVEALRAAADAARVRADGIQRLVPPVEALYAVLSPEQRQVADREVARMLHRGGGNPG